MTTEEIINELENMLHHLGVDYADPFDLYGKRIKGLIDKLKSGHYTDTSNLMPYDDLIYELRAIGFPDLAQKLSMKGGTHGIIRSKTDGF